MLNYFFKLRLNKVRCVSSIQNEALILPGVCVCAGILWNLSSKDNLKQKLARETLPDLTERILIPLSDSRDSENMQLSPSEAEIFYNTTGCLRCTSLICVFPLLVATCSFVKMYFFLCLVFLISRDHILGTCFRMCQSGACTTPITFDCCIFFQKPASLPPSDALVFPAAFFIF